MQKIDYNSINIYWIPTKICIEMHFNKLFMVIKIQLDRSMPSRFMGENTKCTKLKKKKIEEIILLTCILELASAMCLKFCM